jgi:hypothetical protein
MNASPQSAILYYLRGELERLLAKQELGCKVDWTAELVRLLEETQ